MAYRLLLLLPLTLLAAVPMASRVLANHHPDIESGGMRTALGPACRTIDVTREHL